MSDNPRQIYLFKTLGLSHDPFDGPVAEQELHHIDKEPYFFSYYTDLKDPNSSEPLVQVLRKACTGLIFGRPGSGKTTLRYTLEADCRSVYYNRTLIVNYELSHKMVRLATAEELWLKMAQELAIDLFIQVIEQLDTFETPTELQKQHLRSQMALVWPRLRRTVGLILEDDFSDRKNGLASLWPRLNRPAVRHINPSSKIKDLIKDCLPKETKTPEKVEKVISTSLSSQEFINSGQALVEAGIAAAKAWGFEQIFVLVDGIDAYERDVDTMLALISPLLTHLEYWQLRDLFFYFFLTIDVQQPLMKLYGETLHQLPSPLFSYTIEWNKSMLTQLLQRRLQAAGSHITSFNALAEDDFEDDLEDRLIKAAGNSPRQLLNLVSALIDAHAQHAPKKPLITTEDWRQMQQSGIYELVQ